MVRDSRKIAAILAADIVSYSRLMSADEEGTLSALKSCRALFDEVVSEFGGKEFGSVGDSLMAEFPSAVNAVLCAQALQQRIESGNSGLPSERRMQLRIGVNLGDIIEEQGAAFGDTVNVAARLQALAKPGGVLISRPVYDQVHLKVPAHFIDAGTRQVKNIDEPVRTYEVLPAQPAGFLGSTFGFFRRVTSRRVRRAAVAVLVVGAGVALGLLLREFLSPRNSQRLAAALGSQSAAPGQYSIAVLPFVNMSGDPRNDYLGDGLSEEISYRLTRIPQLHVAARTSAFAFKGKSENVSEIAATLGVRYVVEGSIKRQADRIRVTAALVEGASGSNRWSNAYERPSADVLAIQSDISAQVITALELVLGESGAAANAPPGSINTVAYDFYLQGRAYLRQTKSKKSLETAEQLFQRALAAQPNFARAQAGLCETRVERYTLEKIPAFVAAAEEACANARALDSAAQEVHMAVGRLRLATGDAADAQASYGQALALVPQSPDALIGLAEALAAGGKFDDAESSYRRAIAAQSSYAAAHIAYGGFLFTHGRAAEAATAYERATQLAPNDARALSNLGGAYFLMGNFDKAADAFQRSLAIQPRSATYSNAGTVLYYLGRYGEAEQMFRKAIEFTPGNHVIWGNLADAQLFESRPGDAKSSYRRALELADGELAVNPKDAVNQAAAAYYATRLGEQDRARRSIKIALTEGDRDVYAHYYVALAELGLGDAAAALAHVKRARELGYPEKLMRAAPELGELRKKL
ncbi:MAG TPA: tetratricopeptide repeat protein [Steroidobacteraceae bacterium]|nr:tetratricopeptide repeat protein [Steroidobacteraceae bacterium]